MPELIPEAAQVKEEKKIESPESQENRSTAQLVNRLLTISNRSSKNLRGEWPDNYDFAISGHQWSLRRPKWRFAEAVNKTWANIMTEVGVQTDGRPRVEYAAREPQDFQFAEIMKEISDSNWGKPANVGFGWEQKTATALFQSKIYHVVHAEVGWDEELEGGLGDVSYKILDPYDCYWDPIAKNVFENRWFIHAEARPTGELKLKYPDFAERIKPDVTLFPDSASPDGIDDSNIDLYFNTSGAQSRGISNAGAGASGRSDIDSEERWGGEPMTMLIRCWLKDETVEEIKESKEVDGEMEIEFVKKKKFPKGRYIEVIGKMTVTDRENEFDDGLFPIARLVNYDYGEYAGENEVTHQRGPQKALNYFVSHACDQMKKGGVPQWVVSNKEHDLVKKITDEPGLVMEATNPANVVRHPGLPIASGTFQLIDLLSGFVDKISGFQDVTDQPSIKSGVLFDSIVEAAQTRPRLKNRSLDAYLGEVGFLMASRYLQFYKVPRVFRMTNKQGFPEFVEFYIGEDEQGNRVANVQRSSQIEEGGPLAPQEPQQLPVGGLPDIEVVSGTGLPFAKAQNRQLSMDLHARGSITNETLLKNVSFPNAEEEAAKVKEEQAAAAEAEAAQQGASV